MSRNIHFSASVQVCTAVLPDLRYPVDDQGDLDCLATGVAMVCCRSALAHKASHEIKECVAQQCNVVLLAAASPLRSSVFGVHFAKS